MATPAATSLRTGGRTSQGRTPAPAQHAPGRFAPPSTAAPSSPGAVPRRGGRTQQSQPARAGGRTQQATGNYRPGQGPPAPAPSSPSSTAPAARSRAPRPDAFRDRASKVTSQGAGGLLALFAYPIALNLIRGGPAQAWGWVRAKFFNEPYNVAGAGPPAASPVHGRHARGHKGPRPPRGGA